MTYEFNLKDLIDLYNSHLQVSHALWSFIITAYLGVLGLVYASERVATSHLAKIVVSVLCILLAATNYTSIQRSQDIMLGSINAINDIISKDENKSSCYAKKAIRQLKATDKDTVFYVHVVMDIFVIFGIWLQELLIFIERFFTKRHNKSQPTK